MSIGINVSSITNLVKKELSQTNLSPSDTEAIAKAVAAVISKNNRKIEDELVLLRSLIDR